MANLIPIVLLHHNQPDVLSKCINSIIENTRYPYSLFVIDNNSENSKELNEVVSRIKSIPNSYYIKNSFNNWIYGFNLALENSNWKKGEYSVFSDADILFPETGEELCWLGYLVQQMNQHCCIGKLGLNLSLKNIEGNPNLKKTLDRERAYLLGPKIGSNVVAPVDTTAAIYRNDFFILNFKFRIGHAYLGKPHYYICRTDKNVSCIHLGWDYYPGSNQQISDQLALTKKAYAMCKMGAYIAPEIMSQIHISNRLFYTALRLTIRSIHGAKVFLLILIYLIKNFPAKINPIQNIVR